MTIKIAFLVNPRHEPDAVKGILGLAGKVHLPIDVTKAEQYVKSWFRDEATYLEKYMPWINRAVNMTRVGSYKGIRPQGFSEDIQMDIWAIPLIPSMMENHRELAKRLVHQRVQKLAKRGYSYVGLGGHTSIVTDGGKDLLTPQGEPRYGIHVTSGNDLTVTNSIEATLLAASQIGIDPEHATVGVVGAHGRIGTFLTYQLLRSGVSRFALIDREKHAASVRLEARIAQYNKMYPAAVFSGSYEQYPAELGDCDIVFMASSSQDAAYGLVDQEDSFACFKPASVVTDISRPRAIDQAVLKLRPDVLFTDGGLLSVPGDVETSYNIVGSGVPDNVLHACASQTILLSCAYEKGILFEQGLPYDFVDIADFDAAIRKMEFIDQYSKQMGFFNVGLRAWYEEVNEDRIAAVAAMNRGR